MENRGTVETFNDLFDQDHKIFWHRTSAIVCTGFAFVLCLFAASARAKDPDDGVMWKLGAILLACGIGFVGHEGGELTHGKGLYKDLNAVVNEVIPMDSIMGTEADPKDSSDEEGDDDSASGDEEATSTKPSPDEMGKPMTTVDADIE